MSLPPLHRAYAMLLCNLADNGGSGELDRHGRVVVGPTRAVLPGNPDAWLKLVTYGYIGGEDGKLILTEAGRAEAKRYKDGCVAGVVVQE